jgi:hypothetical protein
VAPLLRSINCSSIIMDAKGAACELFRYIEIEEEVVERVSNTTAKNVLGRANNMATEGWVYDGTFGEIKNKKPSPEFDSIENEKKKKW